MKLGTYLDMTPEEKIEWSRRKTAVIDAARELAKEVQAGDDVSFDKLLDAVEALDKLRRK